MSQGQLQSVGSGMLRVAVGAFLGVVALLLLVALLMAVSTPARASEPIVIPETSAVYRLELQRAAAAEFGLNAPVARLAAQIHQESHWRPTAASKFAQGLAQFTPSTAAWLPSVCPDLVGFDRFDPSQAVQGLACYDAWLHRRVRAMGATPLTECTRWNFTLRAYNGGEGWLDRERKLARADAGDPNDYRAVARYRARATWAHRENLGYPQRILFVVEPRYRAAGWEGTAACAPSGASA